MSGYNPEYLGQDFKFDLPIITPEKESDIVIPPGRDTPVLDYLNYSVIMNQETRQAFFSSANADFSNNTGSGRNFRVDSRLLDKETGENFQLDNIYYKDLNGVENPYDRGHIIRRDAISWGESKKAANKASRDSCYFTNVSLQHKNFNQDEWRALEDAIENNNRDQSNRVNIFSGPIFSDRDRFITPTRSLQPGRVPAAFWKVIAYVGKDSGKLEVNAFIVNQDKESIKRLKQVFGKKGLFPFKMYQSSTTLIERLTGLEFPDVAFDNNPLFFFESDETVARGIASPQLIEVSTKNGADCGICFAQ